MPGTMGREEQDLKILLRAFFLPHDPRLTARDASNSEMPQTQILKRLLSLTKTARERQTHSL